MPLYFLFFLHFSIIPYKVSKYPIIPTFLPRFRLKMNVPLEAPNTAQHAKGNTRQSLKPSFVKLEGIMSFSCSRVVMKVKDRSPVNAPFQDISQQKIIITIEAL